VRCGEILSIKIISVIANETGEDQSNMAIINMEFIGTACLSITLLYQQHNNAYQLAFINPSIPAIYFTQQGPHEH